MSLVVSDLSTIFQAFLFHPSDESAEEFKPCLGAEIGDLVSELRQRDATKSVCACLAVHLYLQSIQLLRLEDDHGQLEGLRALLGTSFMSLGLADYAVVYTQDKYDKYPTRTPSEYSSRLASFDRPLSMVRELTALFKGRLDSISLPPIDELMAVGGVDLDASRYLVCNTLSSYKLQQRLLGCIERGAVLKVDEASNLHHDLSNLLARLRPVFREIFSSCIPSDLFFQPAEISVGHVNRIAKGYLNPSWDWDSKSVSPTLRYVYDFLRVDRPCDVRGLAEDDADFKGSLELATFYGQFMNRLCGRLFGICPILISTFPPILPEKLPITRFDATVKLDGVLQQPELSTYSCPRAFKEWIDFCMSANESLRVLNDHNISRMDAVWVFRNKPDTATATYGGLLFALGLLGCLRELPIVAILDILRSGNKAVQCGVLLGLGCTYKGTCEGPIERIIALHIRSHYLNHLERIQLSAEVQSSAVLAQGMLYYNTCDRQCLKCLISEFSRSTPIHEKATLAYPFSFYLCCGIAIGLVSSGNLRGSLNSDQMDLLLSSANGHLHKPHGEVSALVALMIGAAGTGDTALSNCISLDHKQQQRPLHWFYRHLAKLLIEWPDVGDVVICDLIDDYSYYQASAQLYYLGLRADFQQKDRICVLFSNLITTKVKSEGIEFKRQRMAIDFAVDSCLLALAIICNATADGHVVRGIRRYFSSMLDYNCGRSSLHSLALGLVCMQRKKLCLSGHFSFVCLLISILPNWAREFTDFTHYLLPLRYFWAMSCTNKLSHSPAPVSPAPASDELLKDFVTYNAFKHHRCSYNEPQLGKIFRK